MTSSQLRLPAMRALVSEHGVADGPTSSRMAVRRNPGLGRIAFCRPPKALSRSFVFALDHRRQTAIPCRPSVIAPHVSCSPSRSPQ